MESCEFYCCNISWLQSALLAGKRLVLWFNIFICWKCCNYNWLRKCHSKNTRGMFLHQSESRESPLIDQWENRLKGKLLCIAFCVISIPIFARLVYLTTEVLDSMIQKLLEQAKESRKGWYFWNCSNVGPPMNGFIFNLEVGIVRAGAVSFILRLFQRQSILELEYSLSL